MGFDIRKGSYLFKHSIDLEPDNNRENFREHYHPSYELLYFIKGKADFTLRQQIYHLQHHSLLLIKPGDYHNIIIKEIIPYERMVIRFAPNDIPADLNTKLSASSNVFAIQNTLLERELLHLDKYADIQDASVKEDIFFAELKIILCLLTTSDNLRKKEDKINTSVARIIECIDSNLVNIQTIEDIASKLRMSPSTINKVFIKHMQTPVMSYVRTQKCMMAKNLMISGVPANEAALQAGFEYYSTFYRAYKNVFGFAPTGK
jgi:AraC-like DNA-binding protein